MAWKRSGVRIPEAPPLLPYSNLAMRDAVKQGGTSTHSSGGVPCGAVFVGSRCGRV